MLKAKLEEYKSQLNSQSTAILSNLDMKSGFIQNNSAGGTAGFRIEN